MSDTNAPQTDEQVDAKPTLLGLFHAEAQKRPVETLAAVANCFAVFLGGIGLIFVVIQIKEVRAQLDDGAYTHVYDWVRTLDEMAIERPHLRPYFYDGKALPKNEPERAEVLGYAEYKIDFIDYFFSQIEHLDRDKYEYDTWKAYFRESFRESPVMCQVLQDAQEWYGYEIRYIAKPVCPGINVPSVPVENPVFWKYFR